MSRRNRAPKATWRCVADGVLRPKYRDPAEDDVPFFGVSVTEARTFAAKALERRLKVIGLAAAA